MNNQKKIDDASMLAAEVDTMRSAIRGLVSEIVSLRNELKTMNTALQAIVRQ